MSAEALVSITDVKLSRDPVDYLSPFEVTAEFRGDTCNLEAWFYIDDFQYSRKNVPCDAEELSAKLDLKAEDWELNKLTCGLRKAKVEIYTLVTRSMVANMSTEFNIGYIPNVAFTPAQPSPDREARVTLTDEGGSTLSTVDVEIKDIYGGDVITRRTDQTGSFVFTPKAAGGYTLTMKEKDVCGTVPFYVKRPLMVDGPRPEDPVVNEMITLAVPAGAAVGVKVLDSKGHMYKTVPVSYNGGANFTIEDAGAYLILVGENSTKYWELNKTLTVSDRLIPEIKVAPDQPVIGKPATITVSSRGQPIPEAKVVVKKPDGVEREYSTTEYGSVNYDTITSTGTYEVMATKERFATGTTSFEAKHSLDVKLEPPLPTVKDTITMSVIDQNGKPVGDVLVEIPAIGFKRVTDMGGKISFNLQEPKEYDIKITKDLFWDRNLKLTPYGILTAVLSQKEFELGGGITLSALDSFNSPATVDMRVTDPDGIVKYYTAQTYTLTPDKPGPYTTTMTKTNYLDANTTFKVTPHPLDVKTSMSQGNLMINVTSANNPVQALRVSVAKADLVLNGTTNTLGMVVFEMRKEGNITVTVNPGGETKVYEERVLKESVVRSYDLILLTTPLLLIFVITLLTIIAIQLGRKYFGGGDWKMPSIGFGRPQLRSKHDSVLLGGKRGKSRLGNL